MGLLVFISGAILGCKSTEPVRTAAVETVHARIVESRQAVTPATVQATGTLCARETATLSAQVIGRVQQVLVREGDSVRAGQTLVILDDATLKSASEQAEAAVKVAENQQIAAQTNADLAASTLARYKQLQEQKSVSPQEMDEVTRRSEAAKAQVDALRAQSNAMKAQQAGARAMLSYTRVAAPFAGIVTARMADPGALASPGVPLMQIDSAGPLQLQAAVGESAITFVHTGMKVSVSIDGMPGADPQGTVSQIVPAADASSHSFMVKIDLPLSKELRAGMYATAEIPTGTRLAILAPRSAIVVRGSLPCAYVLDSDNTAQLRYVTLGSAHGDAVEILSGIAANEKLVDDPADRDLAGKRIEVRP
jgi:RND family efflux transporter MFP subunit